MLRLVEIRYSYGGDCVAVIGVNAENDENAKDKAVDILLREYAHYPLERENIHWIEVAEVKEGILFLDEG